jgi:uncharacterized membrane protein YqjE
MTLLSLLGLDEWLQRLRKAAAEGAVAAEDRLELATLEWREEKRRLTCLAALALGILGLTVVALVVGSLAVVVSFWDSPYRAAAAWLTAGFWLLLWAAAIAAALRLVRDSGQAFALTRRELARDWQDLKETL